MRDGKNRMAHGYHIRQTRGPRPKAQRLQYLETRQVAGRLFCPYCGRGDESLRILRCYPTYREVYCLGCQCKSRATKDLGHDPDTGT